MAIEEFDIIVVGAGPCGVTLANHLGMYGVRTAIVDSAPGIIDYPRAVGMDDEALRSYQAVGLAEDVLKDMIQNTPVRYYDSHGYCFAHVNPQGQPFGWPRRNLFIQPLTERTLRAGLSRYPSVQLILGCEVSGLSQDEDGVTVAVRDDHAISSFRCAYLVGADGGRSAVRKALGIELEGHTQTWRWLVVDVENDDCFAPFSAVYCHPTRPHMSIDLPYGFRRFEFRLRHEESDEEMQRPEVVARLLAPYFPAGATPSISRSRIYQHHSRIAARFQSGRVFLAGDAAHLQPPFFGQGMNSGLRDATNLAWKLAAVVKEKASPRVLESYDRERRDHARTMVQFATTIGSFYAPMNRLTEAIRTAFFRVLQAFPGARDYILQMKFKPLPRYLEGIVVHEKTPDKRSPIGRMFPQPAVETTAGKRLKLDDAIGNWFSIIGINKDPVAHLSEGQRAFWRSNGATFAMVRKSRSLPGRFVSAPETIVLDDVTGAFRDWIMERPSDEFIILRPDRYVAALCDAAGLDRVSGKLSSMLQGDERQAQTNDRHAVAPRPA
jgi:3-(3-hydroxy-phenyl)propionate hydroxylase